jgi:hypothetical protein
MVINQGAARAYVRHNGALAVTQYSGLLTWRAFDAICVEVIDSQASAECVVMRFDKALTLFGSSRPVVRRDIAAPGAYIVRPDQFDWCTQLASDLGKLGVQRMVFEDSQFRQCREWVDYVLHG